MASLELLDNLLQLLVALLSGIWLMYLFYRTARRCFVFLAGAHLGWALGLVYWVLYLALRGHTPPEPSPAQFVWSGAHLFYLSVISSLGDGRAAGPAPWQAWLAPLCTLPFTLAWLLLGKHNSLVVSLVWGAGFAWIAYRSLAALLLSRAAKDSALARYHALVLAMLLFDEVVLLSALFYRSADYSRFNLYYAFDLLVTLSLVLQAAALKRAVLR